MESNIEIVRAVLAAFAARDIAGVLRFAHPEIEFAPVLARVRPGPSVYHGHAGIRAYFADLSQAWPDLQISEAQLQQAGDAVVVVGNAQASTAHGELRAPALWTWKLRDGLVIDVRIHADEGPARAVLGLARD